MLKRIIKAFVFVIIFLILLNYTTKVMIRKGNGYGTDIWSFYNSYEKYDLIFFGSSQSYATFNPDIIKKESGINSYNFGVQQQPIYLTYYHMVEVLKYQHPQYFVLEMRMFATNDDYFEEGVVRSSIDRMRLSKNKIAAIKTSVEDKEERLSYYFNFIKYHSRYKEIGDYDFKFRGIGTNGFIPLEANKEIIVNNADKNKTSEILKLSSRNTEYLNKIISLAKDNNIKLIFVKTPCTLGDNDQKYYNYVFKVAKENGFAYLDYNNLFKELDLQAGDFNDYIHLSNSGAEKVSKHFAQYLVQKNIN